LNFFFLLIYLFSSAYSHRGTKSKCAMSAGFSSIGPHKSMWMGTCLGELTQWQHIQIQACLVHHVNKY
jgi:hypothetical protein